MNRKSVIAFRQVLGYREMTFTEFHYVTTLYMFNTITNVMY